KGGTMSPLDPADSSPRPVPADPPSAAPDPGAGADTPDREVPRLQHPVRGRRLAPKAEPGPALTPQQRLLLLDPRRRSRLAPRAPLASPPRPPRTAGTRSPRGAAPAGPDARRRGPPPASRRPEFPRRAILMMKESHPDWGVERISAMLLRGPALPACPESVA